MYRDPTLAEAHATHVRLQQRIVALETQNAVLTKDNARLRMEHAPLAADVFPGPMTFGLAFCVGLVIFLGLSDGGVPSATGQVVSLCHAHLLQGPLPTHRLPLSTWEQWQMVLTDPLPIHRPRRLRRRF